MARTSRSLGLGIAFAVSLFLAAASAQAHKLTCDHGGKMGNSSHTHPNKFVVSCNSNGTACTENGVAGTCQTTQFRNAVSCECTPPQGGGGGCLAFGVHFFSDQGDGPPAADSSRIYLAETGPDNFLDVNNGDHLGPSFGAEDGAIAGTVSLAFGSFSTPASVPVTIEDISLTVASVPGAGVTTIGLPGGAFQPLTYDSTTGVIDTVDEAGIMVEMTNAWGTEVAPAHLGAEAVSGGFLVTVQIRAPALVFFDDFESGDTTRWASLLRAATAGLRRMAGLAPLRKLSALLP